MNDYILSVLELQDASNKMRETIVAIAAAENVMSDIHTKLSKIDPDWRRYLLAGQIPPPPKTVNNYGGVDKEKVETLRLWQSEQYNFQHLISQIKNLEMYIANANQRLDDLITKIKSARDLLPHSLQESLE